ncbi:MAG: cupin domain-containing protein [Actinomycetota bacterium]|nr:cupin domain-containing protein [Actinomycetota bacterium]
MTRWSAVERDGVWSGLVETDAGAVSGWHHHGGHDTIAYVLSGELLVEFGPGGGEAVEVRPGDFLLVPAHTVHREGNPSGQVGRAVVVRVGSGDVVVNVAGPDPVEG